MKYYVFLLCVVFEMSVYIFIIECYFKLPKSNVKRIEAKEICYEYEKCFENFYFQIKSYHAK